MLKINWNLHHQHIAQTTSLNKGRKSVKRTHTPGRTAKTHLTILACFEPEILEFTSGCVTIGWCWEEYI